MSDALDTNAKALRINLDRSVYGTFAEIGGGQEVSRWFFRVGGAAGTVAKTMSAYDMAVSDAIYGRGMRYVSRERVRAMLDHEYDLLVERLAEECGDRTKFFAFAETVATRSYRGGNECHGWIGLRFQHAPGAPPSDVLVHVALADPTAEQQQQSLGTFGVNLLHGAYYQRESLQALLCSLLDGLSLDNLEIDVIECHGPAFTGELESALDDRARAIRMLRCGLTRAVAFDADGRMDQPTTVFRKRPLVVHRASVEHDNPRIDAMLASSDHLLRNDLSESAREPLRVRELSIGDPSSTRHDDDAVRARVEALVRPGDAMLLTSMRETFHISTKLREHTTEPIRFVFGLDALVTILCESFYTHGVHGGLLEGLGRLLTPDVGLDVFPMSRSVLEAQLGRHGVDPTFWRTRNVDATRNETPDPDQVLGADDLELAAPACHLLNFMRSAGWIRPVDATLGSAPGAPARSRAGRV